MDGRVIAVNMEGTLKAKLLGLAALCHSNPILPTHPHKTRWPVE